MPRRLSRVVVDTGALRESPAYRRLFTGQLITIIGRQVTVVAVPYQVYLLSHSAALLGLVGAVQAVPLVAVSFASGPLIDRFDRRRVLIICQVALGATAAALFLLSLLPSPPVAAILGVVALTAGITAVEGPARSATIPRLVSPARLAGAISLGFSLFTVGAVAGPALGGLLIGHVSISAAYLVDLCTFGASLTATVMLPPQPPEHAHREPLVRALGAGLRFAGSEPAILGGFVIDLAAMIFGMPRAVFPVLAQWRFHTDATGLGWLYAAPGAGALVAALATGWVAHTARLGRVVVAAVAVWGACIIAFGLTASLPLALLLLVVAGGADSFSAVCRSTMMQTLTPDNLRGRINSLYSMVVRSGPFAGDLEAGVVAQVFGGQALGAEVSVISGGALCLVGLGAAVMAVPGIWRYRAAPPRTVSQSSSAPPA